jgi:hypothetical protein
MTPARSPGTPMRATRSLCADTGHLPKCVLSLEIRMICSGTHDLILESYWV